MTLPFNIVAICTFITILPDTTTTTTQPPTHNITEASISWPGVGHGILVSMGQVYAVHCLQSSCIINLAVLLYSPLLFCMCTLGATIGSILPLNFLSPQDYPQVYAGLWGYSPLLSMAAVSCVIYPLSGTSMLAGTINAITTVFIQKALIVVMGKVRNENINILMLIILREKSMRLSLKSSDRIASVHASLHPCHPSHVASLAGEDEEKGRKRKQEKVFLGRNSEEKN